jgi:serine protease AprX
MYKALARLLVFATLFSILLSGALVTPRLSRASDAPARLSPALGQWLATAGPGATFRTIITFDTYEGMSRLDSLGVGATKLSRLPIAFATLTADQVRAVASWPEARSLWHEERKKPVLDESVPLIKADKVMRGEGLKTPYTGAGVNVAVIDTGVDSFHPDLPAGTKVKSYAVAGDAFEREPMVIAETPTVDTYGHGTHVSSTIAGLGTASGGRYKGVAPGSRIYSFKTDVGAFLLDSYILGCFDWILAHPEENIRVSSNSWGGGDGDDYDPDNPINVAFKWLYDAGITVVIAASNSGGPDTLNTHATSPWVISVAAGTKDLKLASFSSRGRFDPTRSSDVNWDRRRAQRNDTGVYRPTVTAPGEDIEAAKSTQAVVMADGTDPENPFYTYASGTSMATPHVAGVVALMLEARPALKPQHVIDILEGTADNMPSYEIFEVGMGHADAHEAVQAAEKGKVHFPPSINGKTPLFSLASDTPFSGSTLPGTWLIRECPDTTGLLSHHKFTVAPGSDLIYTEIDWGMNVADQVYGPELLYLVLYDPNCQVAGESAALLDIGSVNHRALTVSSPAPGDWTVAVYGRVNALTPYTGAFSTYDER